MTPPPAPSRPIPARGGLGPLLARLRRTRGRSQRRLADDLCAGTGQATVSRHEISRWEREERLPSAYWLSWLARVLDVPLAELERAAEITRGRREARAGTALDAVAAGWPWRTIEMRCERRPDGSVRLVAAREPESPPGVFALSGRAR